MHSTATSTLLTRTTAFFLPSSRKPTGLFSYARRWVTIINCRRGMHLIPFRLMGLRLFGVAAAEPACARLRADDLPRQVICHCCCCVDRFMTTSFLSFSRELFSCVAVLRTWHAWWSHRWLCIYLLGCTVALEVPATSRARAEYIQMQAHYHLFALSLMMPLSSGETRRKSWRPAGPLA